jgi:hypothetical protein
VALWSAAGLDHARAEAARLEVADLFDAILPKPGTIVDDKGWKWAAFTRVIKSSIGLVLPFPDPNAPQPNPTEA